MTPISLLWFAEDPPLPRLTFTEFCIYFGNIKKLKSRGYEGTYLKHVKIPSETDKVEREAEWPTIAR